MAKSKPDKRNQKRKKSKSNGSSDLSPEMAQPLLEQATELLQLGQAEDALSLAKKSLRCLASPDLLPITQIPVLELLGEIYVELGMPDEARKMFLEATDLGVNEDLPEQAGGGADKYLWLAQLSEDGGEDSMRWFEKGCSILRKDIGVLKAEDMDEEELEMLEIKKVKLANALCGAAEVYMTDLSWEEDAETRCESLVTEACLVAPQSPEPLQTLASVRLSQMRLEDARSALQRSLDIWKDLDPEHPNIPAFPTRISLSRLLMEAEMEDKAMDVLDRLVAEDDSSVEAWYLGGWCLHLIAHKDVDADNGNVEESDHSDKETLNNSRKWLLNSLRLYNLLDYEDDRLHDHAKELVKTLNDILGPPPEVDDEDDEWEDDGEDDEDQAMAGT